MARPSIKFLPSSSSTVTLESSSSSSSSSEQSFRTAASITSDEIGILSFDKLPADLYPQPAVDGKYRSALYTKLKARKNTTKSAFQHKDLVFDTAEEAFNCDLTNFYHCILCATVPPKGLTYDKLWFHTPELLWQHIEGHYPSSICATCHKAYPKPGKLVEAHKSPQNKCPFKILGSKTIDLAKTAQKNIQQSRPDSSKDLSSTELSKLFADCYLEKGSDQRWKLKEGGHTIDLESAESPPQEASTSTMAGTLQAFRQLHENDRSEFRQQFFLEVLLNKEKYSDFLTDLFADVTYLKTMMNLEDKAGDGRSKKKRPLSDSDDEGVSQRRRVEGPDNDQMDIDSCTPSLETSTGRSPAPPAPNSLSPQNNSPITHTDNTSQQAFPTQSLAVPVPPYQRQVRVGAPRATASSDQTFALLGMRGYEEGLGMDGTDPGIDSDPGYEGSVGLAPYGHGHHNQGETFFVMPEDIFPGARASSWQQ